MTLSLILAHGLGGRADLPLPAWMFGYGAAAAVLVSFAALALFWPTPRLERGTRERVLARTTVPALRALALVARAAGLAVFVVVLVAAAVGDNSPRTNLAPVVVYVVFWVGVLFASGLLGDVWQVLSPFDTLAAIGQRLRPDRRRTAAGHAGAPTVDDVHEVDVDDDVGDDGGHEGGHDGGHEGGHDGGHEGGHDWCYWPAAVGLLAFVWVELVYPDRAVPRDLFVLMAAYTLVVLAGAARWGRGWLREGEAFAALFGVVSQIWPRCTARTTGACTSVLPSPALPPSSGARGWRRWCSWPSDPPRSTASPAPASGSTSPAT